MTDEDDVAAVRQCLTGDVNAFERIVDKYQKTIYNVVLRVVNDCEDAEDITQCVFIKAFENLKSFDSRYRLFSWLYKIAFNESLNFIGPRKRIRELDDNLASSEKKPDEVYLEIEMSKNIENALMRLDPLYRVVIVLRHFQDLSYREMSYVLEVPEKTVKSRLFTARQLLRGMLLRKIM